MQPLSHIEMPAKIENMGNLIETVIDCARKNNIDEKNILRIELAIEEVLTNVIKYAYESEPGDVHVTCFFDKGNHFTIEIEDQGIPFDALSIDEPDISGDISERKIGGLGIFLLKQTMSDVTYERKKESNILRLTV